MVFQAYTSFDWMSVRKNVEFGMRINGISAAERRERAEHFIKLVGLGKFIDAYPTRITSYNVCYTKLLRDSTVGGSCLRP